jgi:hypothetical protein
MVGVQCCFKILNLINLRVGVQYLEPLQNVHVKFNILKINDFSVAMKIGP